MNLVGAFLVGSVGLPEIAPITAHLADGPLGHLGWQGLEFRGIFQGMSEFCIGGDAIVSEEGLPENVKCGIVQVLGRKTGRIDDGEAWVLAVNDVLFDQLHAPILAQVF